jgi:hypothetical protein
MKMLPECDRSYSEMFPTFISKDETFSGKEVVRALWESWLKKQVESHHKVTLSKHRLVDALDREERAKAAKAWSDSFNWDNPEIILEEAERLLLEMKGNNHVRENVSIGSESIPLVSEEILAQEDKQDKP